MKMKKSTKLGLLEEDMETDKKKKKKDRRKKVKKCPTNKDVKKCENKVKGLKPKQKACKELEGIGKKDVDAITELIKKWNKQKVEHKYCKQSKGETKFHYVSRLSNHFGKKLKLFKKKVDELVKKRVGGKKLKKSCNVLKHYHRKIVTKVCAKIKNKDYACKCQKVITEKKVCSMYDGCYTASVKSFKNQEQGLCLQ